MAWFLLVLTVTLIVLVPVNIYIALKVHKLDLVKNIKNKKLSWIASFVFLYITLILLIWDATNANIIVLHFFVILVLVDIIYSVICMIRKEIDLKYGKEIVFISSIVITFIYLGYGYYVAHHVVETHYEVVATKDIGVDNFRIVQITDSHIGATMNGDKFYEYMEDINKTNPDIVVITGDFIDDDTTDEDMIRACTGLSILKTKYGVYYVYGNHDKGYFHDRNKELRENLEKNNVVILEDEGLEIVGNIYLIGRQDKQTRSRDSAEELMKDVPKEKYTIVLDHQPRDYENEAKAGMDLVISGHTHGGQVFPLQIIDKLTGANNQIYGIETRDNTTFIVSSGIGDWAVKFKTGAKAEYVVIDVKNR